MHQNRVNEYKFYKLILDFFSTQYYLFNCMKIETFGHD